VSLHKFLAIISAVVILILAGVVWFFPPNDDFRMENPFWNGTRETFTYPFSPLKSLADLPQGQGQGAVLVLIPYVDFTAGDLEAIKSFVTRGGTLVLADDYGYGNQVLEYLGLNARFFGAPLLDPLINYKNQWVPSIFHLESSPLTNGIESLVFNHATALMNVEPAATLARSSAFSFIDLNNDELKEDNEPFGPFPVISQHNLELGQIILIADPSLFINSMEEMPGNNNLVRNIATLSATQLFVDQSHLPQSSLQQTKNLMANVRGYLTTPLGTLGLTALALSLTLMPFWRERR